MDHISNHLPKTMDLAVSQGVSEYLAKLSAKVPTDEIQIIQRKYAEIPIRTQEDAQILKKAAEALQTIHVITGWNLPADKAFVKTLISEFVLVLKERFFMLNFKEVVHAFRKNAIGVIDWGKNMNISLICSVLGSYCHEREQASFYEEKNLQPDSQRIYTDDEIVDMQRGWIESAYQAMRKGCVPLIFDCFAEILVKDGFIEKPELISDFFVFCLESGKEMLYVREQPGHGAV